jgi:hypothetical protein
MYTKGAHKKAPLAISLSPASPTILKNPEMVLLGILFQF